jgi:sulfane dehydrogenase subunit SoxC
VPDIDPRRHRLLIHGMVDRPLVLTMDEIRRLPTVSRIYFLECGGNTAGEWDHPRGKDVQTTHGLMSCSEWTGVPLSLLLREVGVQPGASWILAEGGDAAVLTRSLPMSKAMDDALVAYGQNGEALRPEQGYPLRLVVPGWEGIIWVKWLRRLKVVDRPYMTRNETATYTPLMPDGKAWLFPFVMDAKSVPRKPVPVSPTAGDGTADPGRVPLRAALPPQSYRGGGLGGGPKGRSPSDWMGPLRIG